MKINHTAADFARMTTLQLVAFQRRAAMLLWRRAPSMSTAAKMLALRRAQCLAGLARALEANPDLRRM
jgi:hypothetical protein